MATSGRRSGIGATIAVAVPTMLVGFHALAYGRWIVDDAGITFAFARSIATGAGPVLQPGRVRVEGYSNPAWMAILVIGRWLGLFDRGAWFGVPDYVAFPKLVALGCCAGMFVCTYLAACAVSRRPVLVTLIAGTLTAAVPAFVIWCFSGLENALLALAVVALATILVRAVTAGGLLSVATAVSCGLLAAVTSLCRPDGLIYVAAFPLVALLVMRRGQLKAIITMTVVSLGAFAVPAGAYLVWRVLTFDALLPNTALAKSQGLPGVTDLSRPSELIAYVGWLAVLLAVVGVGAAMAVHSRLARGLAVLLVPLGLAVASYAILKADWMGEYRFATPVWPLGALVGTLAAVHVIPRLQISGRVVVAALATLALVTSGITLTRQAHLFRADPTAPLCLVAEINGRNFNGFAEIVGRPDSTFLVPDIGGAALTSKLGIVDLDGLADARIAGYRHTKNWVGLRDYLFDDLRPTFISSHGIWSSETGLAADPRLASEYVEIATIGGSPAWIRLDAMDDPTTLERLRAYATDVATPVDARARQSPLSSCGAVLR